MDPGGPKESAPPHRRQWARGLRISIRIALALLAAFALALAILAGKLDGIVHARLALQASNLGDRLGRAITVGPTHVKLGRTLDVTVDDLTIAAAPGQTGIAAAPILSVHAVHLRLDALPLLFARDRGIHVRLVEAQRPEITVVRLADKTFSYADIATRLASSPPPPAKTEPLVIDRAAVIGAAIRIHAITAPPDPDLAPVTLEAIDVTAEGIAPGAPVTVTVDAALLAPTHNLHASTTIDAGTLRRAEVHLDPVAIDPILAFVPPRGGIQIKRAIASADMIVTLPEATEGLEISGSLGAKDLTILHRQGDGAPSEGRPMDVAAKIELLANPKAASIAVRTIELDLGSMGISGSADLRNLRAAPEIHALDVSSRGLTLEGLLALAPKTSLPPDTNLTGPIAIHARAEGAPREATIDASIDLGDATISAPSLHKPPGTALTAELHGKLTPGGLDVASLGLVVGPLALKLHGQVKSPTELDLGFDSGRCSIDGLLRLSPAIARAVPKSTALKGAIQASGQVKRAGADTTIDAKIALRDADAVTRALTLTGSADLGASATIDAPGAVTATVDLDLSHARVQIPGQIDKAAGAPMHLAFGVDHRGAVTTVKDARIELPGATAHGSAQIDADKPAISAKLTDADVDLARLLRAIPAIGAAPLPPSLTAAHLRFGLALDGNPEDLAAAHLRLETLDFTAPVGHLRGTADVTGLRPPRKIALDLDGDSVDLDKLTDLAPVQRGAPSTDPAPAIDAKIRITTAHAHAVQIRDFSSEIAFADRKLAVKSLRVSAFGGTADAASTTVDLGGKAPSFQLALKLAKMDLAAIAALRSDLGPTHLAGKLDADISLQGTGADLPSIENALAGRIELQLTAAKIQTIHTVRETIVNPLLDKIAELDKAKHPTRNVDLALSRLTTAVRIYDRKLLIVEPIRADVDEGSLELEGEVRFDKHLALTGALSILPAAIEKASNGALLPKGPVPVKFKITGTSDAPAIELLDLAATAKSLEGSLLRAIGKKIKTAFSP